MHDNFPMSICCAWAFEKLHVDACFSARMHDNCLIWKLYRDFLMVILSQQVVSCTRLSHLGSGPRKSRGEVGSASEKHSVVISSKPRRAITISRHRSSTVPSGYLQR